MIRFIHRYSLFLILSVLLPYSVSAADTNGTWQEAANRAEELKSAAQTHAAEVRNNITRDHASLARELADLKKTAAQARSKAAALETELRALRDEETTLERLLEGKQGTMRKIEGTVRDNARLLLAAYGNNPALSLHPEWKPKLKALAASEQFPALHDVTFLMQSLLHTIRESGTMLRREENVHTINGATETAKVLRLGALQTAYTAGDETGFLLPRPDSPLLQAAPLFSDSDTKAAIRAAVTGTDAVPMDFSGTSLIANPPAPRTIMSTLNAGGLFLWPILIIGIVGAGLVAERCFVLCRTRINGRQVLLERSKDITQNTGTPAERVAARVRGDGAPASVETLEKRLEESILDELPPLERFLQTLRVLAAVSPLLGLLGTVSGIIQTFRVITEHGNGDPKLLSAGISEALLTTEVGLFVAIPLLLCHHFLSRRVNAVVTDMEVTGTALIVERAGEAGVRE